MYKTCLCRELFLFFWDGITLHITCTPQRSLFLLFWKCANNVLRHKNVKTALSNYFKKLSNLCRTLLHQINFFLKGNIFMFPLVKTLLNEPNELFCTETLWQLPNYDLWQTGIQKNYSPYCTMYCSYIFLTLLYSTMYNVHTYYSWNFASKISYHTCMLSSHVWHCLVIMISILSLTSVLQFRVEWYFTLLQFSKLDTFLSISSISRVQFQKLAKISCAREPCTSGKVFNFKE